MTESSCVWVYAVAHDAAPPFTGGLIGVGGGTMRPLTAAGLMVIGGSVPQSEFGEAALRQNLEDLDWLERTARAHHEVIETVAKERPVVPMRLATVYSSDEAVAGMMRERAADLRQALTRLTGRSEWGVKAHVAMLDDGADGQQSETDGPASGPGAAYLRRRHAQLAARQDARQEAVASAQAVHVELSLALGLGSALPAPVTGDSWPFWLDDPQRRVPGGGRPGQGVRSRGNGACCQARCAPAHSDRAMARILLCRPGCNRGRAVSEVPSAAARYHPAIREDRVALVDLLDRVLAGGVVIVGDVTLSIADVDLVTVSLRALVTSVSALMEGTDDSQENS